MSEVILINKLFYALLQKHQMYHKDHYDEVQCVLQEFMRFKNSCFQEIDRDVFFDVLTAEQRILFSLVVRDINFFDVQINTVIGYTNTMGLTFGLTPMQALTFLSLTQHKYSLGLLIETLTPSDSSEDTFKVLCNSSGFEIVF